MSKREDIDYLSKDTWEKILTISLKIYRRVPMIRSQTEIKNERINFLYLLEDSMMSMKTEPNLKQQGAYQY